MTRVGIMALAGAAPVDGLRELGVSVVRTAPRRLLRPDGMDPQGVAEFRAHWQPHVDAGLRLHVCSPFPGDLTGVDPGDTAWEATWERVGAELGEGLGDMVASWQLGNELNIWQFRDPLPGIAEAVRFVAALGRGLRAAAPHSRLGVNAFGVAADAAALYGALYGPDSPVELDYIGVDAYPGCWVPGGPQEWRGIVERVWELGGGRPITICEIGFPSRGEVAAPGEFAAFVRGLGYPDPASVEVDRGRLLEASPGPLAEAFARLPASSWEADFVDSGHHLLRKWRWGWGEGPHSPEKQARYFGEALDILLPDERVEEVLLFMFQDMERCWSCGQEDCPLETSWGFVDSRGRPKPVFEAVRRRIGVAAG